VLIPAVVFLSLLMLFGLAGSTFFSFSPVSPVHAQSAAPVFPEADANVNYNRTVDENQGPYEPEENRVLQRVLIGEPGTATGDGITYSLKNARKSLFEIDRTTGQLMVGAPSTTRTFLPTSSRSSPPMPAGPTNKKQPSTSTTSTNREK
jgi:hypothetical protein